VSSVALDPVVVHTRTLVAAVAGHVAAAVVVVVVVAVVAAANTRAKGADCEDDPSSGRTMESQTAKPLLYVAAILLQVALLVERVARKNSRT